MAAKAFFLICASALLVKVISAQCIGNINSGLNGLGWAGPGINSGLTDLGWAGPGINPGLNGLGWAGPGFAPGCGAAPVSIATNGGSFAVTSSSPITPNGIQIISKNAIDGTVAVTGQLPVSAAVSLEGRLPTAGSTAINYSCGNGNVGISETSGLNTLAAGPGIAGVAPGLVGPLNGLPDGQMGIGSGCGGIYW